MEVPVHLGSDFHVLQNLSYKMKSSNEGMKRSLKFDEANLGLLLDVQLPGQDWQRIRPDQARLAARSDPSLRVGPPEMSGDMIAGTVRARRLSLALQDGTAAPATGTVPSGRPSSSSSSSNHLTGPTAGGPVQESAGFGLGSAPASSSVAPNPGVNAAASGGNAILLGRRGP